MNNKVSIKRIGETLEIRTAGGSLAATIDPANKIHCLNHDYTSETGEVNLLAAIIGCAVVKLIGSGNLLLLNESIGNTVGNTISCEEFVRIIKEAL